MVTTTKRLVKPAKPVAQLDPELEAEMAADAAAITATPDQLSVIKAKAAELVEYQLTLEGLGERVAAVKKEIEKLQTDVLPSLMDEAQVTLIGLEGDCTLERGEKVFASISKANAPEATKWLEDIGAGALIKLDIKVELEKGDVALAKKVRDLLTKSRIGFSESSGVHPQTLLAFVKERLADGKPLPESITYMIQPLVTVKPPKKSKK